MPRPSTARDAVLVVAGGLLLVLLWFSPLVARPALLGEGYSGGNAPVDHAVLTFVELAPRTVGSVRIDSVEAAPGAHVAQAWVVRDRPGAAPEGPWADEARKQAGEGDDDPLPASVRQGEDASLVIAWAIDDCAQLVEGTEPTVHLTTAIGTRAEVTLPDMSGPMFDRENLLASPACLG